MKPSAIYYCYTSRASFVAKDIRLLSEKYCVAEHQFKVSPKYLTPFSVLFQFISLLRALPKVSVFVCQFAGYHSFLPSLLGKIFGKPCVIVPGGTDCVSFPSIHYGNFNKRGLGFFTRHSCQMAAHLAPVHQTLMEYNYTYAQTDFPKQGIKYFCPQLQTPFTVIYNGYDPAKWFKTEAKKTNSFLTVASSLDKEYRRVLKGVDLIIEIADRFPEYSFSIVGLPTDAGFYPNKPNITFYPFIRNEDLIHLYSQHEYYLQLSLSEGFPNAVCEAMLCECIPMVSDVSSMPFIIADTGFILKKRDINELEKLFSNLNNFDKEKLGKAARARILENFPEINRKHQLHALIDSLIY